MKKFLPGLKLDRNTFILIVICLFFSFLFISFILGLIRKNEYLLIAGDFQIKSGLFLFFLGILGILGSRRGLSSRHVSKAISNEPDDAFMDRRERERPVEFIAFSISSAG